MTNHEFLAAVAHEFELSFLVTGLRPVNRSFGDGREDGCLVTALDVSEHGSAGSAEADWKRDAERIDRVRDHLLARFPVADRDWWTTFVGYLILSFDHFATCPRQWMQRVCDGAFSPEASPKLMGAAVGGLLRHRLLLAKPVQEQVPLPRTRQVVEQPCERVGELVEV